MFVFVLFFVDVSVYEEDLEIHQLVSEKTYSGI